MFERISDFITICPDCRGMVERDSEWAFFLRGIKEGREVCACGSCEVCGITYGLEDLDAHGVCGDCRGVLMSRDPASQRLEEVIPMTQCLHQNMQVFQPECHGRYANDTGHDPDYPCRNCADQHNHGDEASCYIYFTCPQCGYTWNGLTG